MDFEQTLAMGAGALATRARARTTAALIAAAAAALAPRRGRRRRASSRAREHRAEAVALLDAARRRRSSRRASTRFYYLGWAENYLERYDEALAHVDRGIAIARATGQGRLLVPLMLAKGYPLEMQGRPRRGGRGLRGGGRGGAAVRRTATTSSGRCSSSPGRATSPATSTRRSRPARRACGYGERLDRRHDARRRAAGRAGRWRWRLLSPGETERACEAMRALGSDEIEFAIPVERCFDWESSRSPSSRSARRGGRAHAAAGRGAAAELAPLPAGGARGAARGRRSCCTAGDAEAAIAPAEGAVEARRRPARGCRPRSRAAARAARWPAAGERKEAIAELREAERELDACGSVRERDAVAARAAQARRPRASRAGPAAGEIGRRRR